MKKIIYSLCFLYTLTTSYSFGQSSALYCQNKGYPADLTQGYNILYSIDDSVQEYLACGQTNIAINQVLVAVIDPITCEPWCSPGISPYTNTDTCQQNMFGQMNVNGSCGRIRPEKLFYWNQGSSSSMTSLSDFIDNIIPDSAYVLIYSWILNPTNVYGLQASGSFSAWSSNILNSFHSLGFAAIDTIALTRPWIFFTKKGDLNTSVFVIGSHAEDTISLTQNICGTGVGISEDLFQPFTLYPNPVANTVTIETKTGSGNYQLHDVTGKLLLSGTLNATRFNLDVSALSKGVYFLSLQTIKGRTTRKIEVVK